jgi:hypothetical protein
MYRNYFDVVKSMAGDGVVNNIPQISFTQRSKGAEKRRVNLLSFENAAKSFTQKAKNQKGNLLSLFFFIE